jgi:hypothetical protein
MELGFNPSAGITSISRLGGHKSVLDDNGVALCQKCKAIMDPDDSTADIANNGNHMIGDDEIMRVDINANKSIISKVEKLREIRASKIQAVYNRQNSKVESNKRIRIKNFLMVSHRKKI